MEELPSTVEQPPQPPQAEEPQPVLEPITEVVVAPPEIEEEEKSLPEEDAK